MHFFSSRSCAFGFLLSSIFFAAGISISRAQNEISVGAREKLLANSRQVLEGNQEDETGFLIVNEDKAQAIAEVRNLWLKVKEGDPQAQYSLGIRALQGRGFTQSTRQGLFLLGRAADQKHEEALYYLLANYASDAGLPLNAEDCKTMLDGKLERVTEIFQSKKLTPYEKAVILDNYIKAYKNSDRKVDRKVIFEKLRAPFAKEFPDSSILYFVDGEFFIDYAWDARTDRLAYKVSEEQFREFGKLLFLAKQSLEKSYEMDHKNYLAASKMIVVSMGLSLPREEMEKWFNRAIEADSKSLFPYNAKMTYLEPKWLGSPEELLEFGRECLKKGQWKTNIPYQLVLAHERLSAYVPKPAWKPDTPPRYPYFEKRGVWEDILPVFEGYIKDDPTNDFIRSKFARYACMCKQWSVAKEQFSILGKDIVLKAFSDLGEHYWFEQLATK